MSLILVADAAYPFDLATLPADTYAVAGYVGGDTPHVWTPAQEQAVRAAGLEWWGIWTAPSTGERLTAWHGQQAAAGQIAAYRARNYPQTSPAFLDIEHATWAADPLGARACITAWQQAMNAAGWAHAVPYVPLDAGFGWVAYWTNEQPATLPAGWAGQQYGGSAAATFDLSVFDTVAVGVHMALDPKDPVIVALQEQINHLGMLVLYGDSKESAYGTATQTHPFNLFQIKQELDALKSQLASLASPPLAAAGTVQVTGSLTLSP